MTADQVEALRRGYRQRPSVGALTGRPRIRPFAGPPPPNLLRSSQWLGNTTPPAGPEIQTTQTSPVQLGKVCPELTCAQTFCGSSAWPRLICVQAPAELFFAWSPFPVFPSASQNQMRRHRRASLPENQTPRVRPHPSPDSTKGQPFNPKPPP